MNVKPRPESLPRVAKYSVELDKTCGNCGKQILLVLSDINLEEEDWQNRTIYCGDCCDLMYYDKNGKKRFFDLETMPYALYLKTDYWFFLRQATLDRYNHQCAVCNSSKGLEVHHRTYERRGKEQPNDVIALCGDCHSLFHQHGKLHHE